MLEGAEDRGRLGQEMLGVVEDEERLSPGELARHLRQRVPGRRGHRHRLEDGAGDVHRLGEIRQRHEPDGARCRGERARELDRKASLAGAARAEEGHEPGLGLEEEMAQALDLAAAADEARAGDRNPPAEQTLGVGKGKRGGRGFGCGKIELEEPGRLGFAAELVEPELGDVHRAGRLASEERRRWNSETRI